MVLPLCTSIPHRTHEKTAVQDWPLLQASNRVISRHFLGWKLSHSQWRRNTSTTIPMPLMIFGCIVGAFIFGCGPVDFWPTSARKAFWIESCPVGCYCHVSHDISPLHTSDSFVPAPFASQLTVRWKALYSYEFPPSGNESSAEKAAWYFCRSCEFMGAFSHRQ